MTRSFRILAVALAVAAAACAKGRDLKGGTPRCAAWEGETRPILERACVSCHAGEQAQGGYRLDTYIEGQGPDGFVGIVSRRADGTLRVAPGDMDSALLRAARNELPGHPAVQLEEGDLALLEDWVQVCRATKADYLFHDPGFMNPGDSQQFHGRQLRVTGYDLEVCRRCHADETGELTGASVPSADCRTCHPGSDWKKDGSLRCRLCHGDTDSPAPPRDLEGLRTTASPGVGAHRQHLTDGPLHVAYACSNCHPSFEGGVYGEGHFLVNGQPDVSQASLSMQPPRGESASYDRASATCTVYCHKPSAGAAGSNMNPVWTAVGQGQASCGACHGLPPAGAHPPDDRCGVCHPQVVQGGQIANKSLHADGTVTLGDGSGVCTGCHGSAQNPAPPRDLSGRTGPATLPSIGAHQAHLQASELRGPIPCSECHQVPAEVTSAGHLDGAPVEVFPNVAGVGTLARSDGASPSYDASTGTCSSVYCHGSGTKLGADPSPGLIRSPSWTAGASAATCGACHGLPPQDAAHASVPSTTPACNGCHPSVVSPGGSIVFTVDEDGKRTSKHVNGEIDLF